jgi:hypothetical protein
VTDDGLVSGHKTRKGIIETTHKEKEEKASKLQANNSDLFSAQQQKNADKTNIKIQFSDNKYDKSLLYTEIKKPNENKLNFKAGPSHLVEHQKGCEECFGRITIS